MSSSLWLLSIFQQKVHLLSQNQRFVKMSNILTLNLDSTSQALFEALRREHFPPQRNHIPAHLTLFHTVPSGMVEEFAAIAEANQPFPLPVTGLRSIGKGVAYTLTSQMLQTLHSQLAATLSEHLTPQDRQPFKPHVVIQNKVNPKAARILLATLQSAFVPFEARALGLDLWEYLNGPWRYLETFKFR